VKPGWRKYNVGHYFPDGKAEGRKVLTYQTGHFTVQATESNIFKAVAYAKHVDKTAYPLMLKILGHKPKLDTHIVRFNAKWKHVGIYGESGAWEGLRASRVYIRPSKLHSMPPYQDESGIIWEPLHALLDEAKKKAAWKPIWAVELLDIIFEFERRKASGQTESLERLRRKYLEHKPESRYAQLGKFWKRYGWEPFNYLINRIHDDPEFKPVLNEPNFAYYMSLGAKRDVTPFFRSLGLERTP
jgi:hypothetical protein